MNEKLKGYKSEVKRVKLESLFKSSI